MSKENIQDKIRKLLALAESPNENEAKAALLKARELMAKHKISERDLAVAKESAVKDVDTGVTFSKRRNPWTARLASIIGDNYCCRPVTSRNQGKQTREIGFIGLEGDIEICVAVFQYAMDCILSECKEIRKLSRSVNDIPATDLCDSYGYGFCEGLREAFEKQTEQQVEWGLVLVVPKEVNDAMQGMAKESFHAKAKSLRSAEMFAHGRSDGEAFDPARRISV